MFCRSKYVSLLRECGDQRISVITRARWTTRTIDASFNPPELGRLLDIDLRFVVVTFVVSHES